MEEQTSGLAISNELQTKHAVTTLEIPQLRLLRRRLLG
jgi:hypothetical protein